MADTRKARFGAGCFYRAEEYHQRYLEKHGLAGCHLA